MTEEFLYYIWQFRLWAHDSKTFSGQDLYIEKPGIRNTNAGPDFLNAQIRIGDVLWAGNIEIHVKTSDWFFHNHQWDPNYKNLILHVVYHHDLDELPHDCPLLVLQGKIKPELIQNYQYLQESKSFIFCENLFQEVDEFTINNFVESLFIERLEKKVNLLDQRLAKLNGDWEALLFERIAYVFGLKINAYAFELLAKSFSFQILNQLIRKNENLEAFLFGQAGFLNSAKDEYQLQLQKEYEFLQHKYQTESIEQHLFKFLRLRPPNFPTVRIAQLAAFYKFQNKLFAEIMRIPSEKEFLKIFQNIQASSYWDTHYNFGTESTFEVKTISDERLRLLLLNAVVPVKYLYQLKQGNENDESLLELVRSIKPEENSIIQKFQKIGAKVENAMDSQAYLELKKNYCDSKKCLNCRIGNKIIRHVR
ncbi:MAG: DUF2851 family protein [Flavobacteriaceae bacterium]|nr:DUF2851 family protein [Flavobacteriaceae bacterium]